MMVPIDLRGAGDEDIELDLEEMVEKLGAKKSAEIFVKCADYFAANHDNVAEDERLQPVTVAKWKEFEDNDDVSLDLDFLEQGDSEGGLESSEEEDDDDEEEEA